MTELIEYRNSYFIMMRFRVDVNVYGNGKHYGFVVMDEVFYALISRLHNGGKSAR